MGVLYFDNLTSSTGLKVMVEKRKGNFGDAHDSVNFSPPRRLILDSGYWFLDPGCWPNRKREERNTDDGGRNFRDFATSRLVFTATVSIFFIRPSSRAAATPQPSEATYETSRALQQFQKAQKLGPTEHGPPPRPVSRKG